MKRKAMLISFYSSLKYHHSSAIQRKLNFQLAGQDKLLCIAVYTSTCLERDLPVLISTHRLSFSLVLLRRGKLEKKECCGTYLAAHQLLNHQHKRTKTTLEAGLTTSQRRIVWFKTHMPPNNTLLQHLLATTHEEGEKGRQGTEEINQNVTGQPDSTTSNIALIQEAATKLFCPLGSCLIEN